MNFAQVRVGDVGVDLSCVDGSVAEKLLHRADISAIAEQVGGEGVAKRVRSNDTRNAGARDIRLQMPLNIARNDAM